MNRWGFRQLRSRARRAVSCAALVLFALQLTIPAGFMPDAGALKAGHYEVVICTGTGFKTITVDESGRQVDPGQSDDSQAPGQFSCPFFKVAAQAAALPTMPVLAAPVVHVAIAVVRDRVATVRRAGPTLGSRAPPLAFG